MKKRIKLWINHILWQYSPPMKKILDKEASRYFKYLKENYEESQQFLILKQLKHELLDFCEEEIKNKEIEIVENQEKIKILTSTIEKTIKNL